MLDIGGSDSGPVSVKELRVLGIAFLADWYLLNSLAGSCCELPFTRLQLEGFS